MFGDHLPFLGVDGLAYREAGYIKNQKVSEWTAAEQKRMRSVPFFAWANFPNFENPIAGTVSPIYLPYYISDMAGIEPPPFYKYLHHLEKNVPGLTDEVKLSRGGEVTKDVPAGYREDIDKYWFIQYDMMFGERYTSKLFF